MVDFAEPGRRPSKSAAAFRTISEVADSLEVPQHVLRFWETKFTQVRPLKRGGGRRYYRPEDVELLRSIRTLLYDEGYTIKGVQKLLREGGIKAAAQRLDGDETGEGDAASGAVPPVRGNDVADVMAVLAEATGAVPAGSVRPGLSLPDGARGELLALLDELEEIRSAIDEILARQ